MDEAPLLGGMSSPEEEMGPDLFGAEGRFVSENTGLKAPAVVKAEEEEFHVFKDPYLSPAGPKEPLLHAFNPPLGADFGSKVKVELLADDHEEEILGQFPSLAELDPLEDAVLPAAPPPPPTYNVHLLSSLLTPHRSPALLPLGAWALDGAAHAGVRVIPVRWGGGGGWARYPLSPPGGCWLPPACPCVSPIPGWCNPFSLQVNHVLGPWFTPGLALQGAPDHRGKGLESGSHGERSPDGQSDCVCENKRNVVGFSCSCL